jgi:hypothetical protein
MKTAKRMKKKNPWLAWIPIANVYLITKMAGLNGWWTLILLACIIPWIGGLIVCGFLIWFFWLICKKRKYPEILSFLLIIPIIGYMILIGILAWGKK